MSPIYRNNSSSIKTLCNKTVRPNEQIVSFIYFDEDEIELKRVKDEPCYNPVILSETVVKECELKIPEKDSNKDWVEKFVIHLYVESGSVEIFYNSFTNLPSLKLYESAKWNVRCVERKIDKIIFKGSDFKVWVVVERS